MSPILQLAAAYWPLLALGATMLVTKAASAAYQRQRLARSGIKEIDRMGGEVFERRLAILFRQRGYRVDLTPVTGDYGADLILEKDFVKTAVQAKRWSSRVGPRAVRDILASKAHYGCTEAMVVTNNGYTRQARTEAKENNILLWDRNRLITELLTTQPARGRSMALALWTARAGAVSGVILCCVALWPAMRALPLVAVLALAPEAQRGAPAAVANVAAIPSLGEAAPTTEPVPASVVEAAALPGPRNCGQAMISGVEALNIRSAPTINAPIVGHRVAGAVLTLLCVGPVEADGVTWRRVHSLELEGWMSSRFLVVMDSTVE